ncbi:hypothetical protein C5B42_05150 [Candidatus Cerribacteria bacterium 'Amazon FNV 2010 28 9']|uniref:Transcriptional regulator n=1 Tax=Candidatus Cerribacteria bacterium 'Amazon FNV 2010 28 9' TaxID=2081795 RepID=A0A317JM99_9BACT|nr:MAG: hypothetical protein C5B42_05150 [Candidatus Cerribacteria bacterium 'Amazon FNV 2010 28 9']
MTERTNQKLNTAYGEFISELSQTNSADLSPLMAQAILIGVVDQLYFKGKLSPAQLEEFKDIVRLMIKDK